LIPSFGFELWDTSWLLPQDSFVGRALHALMGYSDRPMGVQLAAYLVVLAVLAIGAHRVEARSAPAVPAGAVAPASKRIQPRERS
jgi:high-affinity iron transporter